MSGIHEEVQSEGGTSRRPPLVLHVVIALDGGGLERLVVDWTNARNERWPGSTWICCLDRPGALAAEVRDEAVASIHARRGRFPFDVAAVRRLRCMYGQRQKSAAGANPPLVVHSHNTAAQQYATLALVGRGIPHVHTEHGTNPHFGGWLQRLRNVWMTRATDCVVAVSEDTADALVRDQRIPREKIRVIPNGVSAHRSLSESERTALRKGLNIDEGTFVIGWTGRLAKEKGQDRLLGAFAGLDAAAHGSSVLLLAGDGRERGALERLAVEFGVQDRVRFAGFRLDGRALLDVMDLFVLPSRSEGLPVALLEAMAAGVPVMATDAGESWEIIEQGACGMKLPEDEVAWPEAVAKAMGEVAAGSDRIASQVSRARERVRQRYSLSATLTAYEEIYEGVGR